MDTENSIGIKEKYFSRVLALLENLSVEEINILLLELSIFVSDFNLVNKEQIRKQKFVERGGFTKGVVLDNVIDKDQNEVKYDKLVRDKIPEYLDKIGCQVDFHIVNGEELQERLKKKVWEEFAEFCEKPNEEELADLEEVLLALFILNN